MSEFEAEPTWTELPRAHGPPTQRHAFLIVLAGPQFGDVFSLDAGKELVIGRREDADVQVRDDGISRRHASIRVVGEGAEIKDLGSANGTFVDGERVTEARLVDGSRLTIGLVTTLKFVWTDELEARWQLKVAEGALQDPLTGLYNRRHLEDRLAAELAAAQRHQRLVSVLMVDVDHFKRINDDHGHMAGDEALKMVAYVLRGAIRKEDVLARFGGEEFVVVARETGLAGARALGERIRRAVERSRCQWQGRDLALTVSIGVTVSVGLETFVPGQTDRDMIASADQALYLAKQAGRNRVIAIPMQRSGQPAEGGGGTTPPA
jgi:diguanylate cyclase (GGDEF)-like protein